MLIIITDTSIKSDILKTKIHLNYYRNVKEFDVSIDGLTSFIFGRSNKYRQYDTLRDEKEIEFILNSLNNLYIANQIISISNVSMATKRYKSRNILLEIVEFIEHFNVNIVFGIYIYNDEEAIKTYIQYIKHSKPKEENKYYTKYNINDIQDHIGIAFQKHTFVNNYDYNIKSLL